MRPFVIGKVVKILSALAAVACMVSVTIWSVTRDALELYTSPEFEIKGKKMRVLVLMPEGWHPNVRISPGHFTAEIHEDPAMRGNLFGGFPFGRHREPGYILIKCHG